MKRTFLLDFFYYIENIRAFILKKAFHWKKDIVNKEKKRFCRLYGMFRPSGCQIIDLGPHENPKAKQQLLPIC